MPKSRDLRDVVVAAKARHVAKLAKEAAESSTPQADQEAAIATMEEDYNLFLDLVSKMLIYEPEDRITPQDALRHPFLLRDSPLLAPCAAPRPPNPAAPEALPPAMPVAPDGSGVRQAFPTGPPPLPPQEMVPPMAPPSQAWGDPQQQEGAGGAASMEEEDDQQPPNVPAPQPPAGSPEQQASSQSGPGMESSPVGAGGAGVAEAASAARVTRASKLKQQQAAAAGGAQRPRLAQGFARR